MAYNQYPTLTALTQAVDDSWTLFLDRDGVINKRVPNDYIKQIADFQFLDGVLQAMTIFALTFRQIIVLTNQQGVGKHLMSNSDLQRIHMHLKNTVAHKGGRIDEIYFAPDLSGQDAPRRKPNAGMIRDAMDQYPQIDLDRSILIGDMPSDIELARRAKIQAIQVGQEDLQILGCLYSSNLLTFAQMLG